MKSSSGGSGPEHMIHSDYDKKGFVFQVDDTPSVSDHTFQEKNFKGWYHCSD